jgi:membrane peptidoglycan carboxypeptidase
VFGKTGTTDGERTAGLIAGTTSLVVAGYLVNPDYQNHPDHLKHFQVNPAVWNTLADYMKGKPKIQFKKPGNRKIAYGDQRSIPDVECAPLETAKSRLRGAGFSVYVGQPIDSTCPAGTAADSNPNGRTIKGGVVEIEPSNGKGATPLPGQSGAPTAPPTRPPRR